MRMQSQRLDRPFEILIIDSGSTDGTIEFLRRQPVRLIEIPNAEFNHGLTRAVGIRESRGEIVVMTVQDAWPADDQWMQRLVSGFADNAVAGVYSRQIARSNANPFARARLEGWLAADEAPRVQRVASRTDFEALSPAEKLRRTGFDNVSSSVRRSVALEFPFRECRFGEDRDWAYRVLLAGHTIVYEPRSCVIHSHNNSLWYEFKRVYLDHQSIHFLLGVRTVPGFGDLIWRTTGGAVHLFREVANDTSLSPVGRINWWSRVIPHSFAQTLAQYLGALSSHRRRSRSSPFGWIDRILGRGV